MKELDKVQRLTMLSMTHPLRSTPTAGMEAMLGWIPLSIHAREVGMNTYLRNKKLVRAGWDGIGKYHLVKGHLGVWREIEDRCIGISYPREEKVSENIWMEEVKEVEDNREWEMELPLAVYTDASKEGANIGYCWIATIGDYIIEEEMSLAKDISVYKAEMLAIKEAVSWLKENAERNRSIIIYSDSKSAVQVLQGNKAKDILAKETMWALRELTSTYRTKVSWIKGHSDITGNEVADAIAKKGALEATALLDTKPHMPVTYRELKKKINCHFIKEWQIRWESLKDCRISRLFYQEVGDRPWVTKLPIKELQQIVQFVTGHGLYRGHLRNWNELESDQCSLCGEADENTWHLWEWCPMLTKERNEIRSLMKSGLTLERGVLRIVKSTKVMEICGRNEAILGS